MIKLNKINKHHAVSPNRQTVHEDMSIDIFAGTINVAMFRGQKIKILQTNDYGVQRHLNKLDAKFSYKLNRSAYFFDGNYDDYLDEWWN